MWGQISINCFAYFFLNLASSAILGSSSFLRPAPLVRKSLAAVQKKKREKVCGVRARASERASQSGESERASEREEMERGRGELEERDIWNSGAELTR